MAFGLTHNRTCQLRIIELQRLLQNVICCVLFLVLIQTKYSIGSMATTLPKFTLCNSHIDMDKQGIHQGELSLFIRDIESSNTRVSCDVRIEAGYDRQVMFYLTDLYLGSPNGSYKIEKACIEPRDVNGYHETRLIDMRRSRICSSAEVEIGSRVYATTGSALLIRFYRNRGFSMNAYLKLVFTAFRLGTCRTTERKCRNERCIAHDLVCNDRNPCGDHSDCPTGLEHLSSWAMSGIVILAILSGGIIIIMATVCLQRSGNKQSDWIIVRIAEDAFDLSNYYYGEIKRDFRSLKKEDLKKNPRTCDDISTTIPITRPDNNVELTDVIATTTERRLHTEKNMDFCGHSRVKPECVPLYNGTNSGRLKDKKIILETEKLNDDNLMSSDTCPIMYNQTSSETKNSLLYESFDVADMSTDTVNTSVSSHNFMHAEALSSGDNLVADVPMSTFRPKRPPEGYQGISEYPIVLTDSDSGADNDSVCVTTPNQFRRNKATPSPIPKLPSHPNGTLRQSHAARDPAFSEFKPVPVAQPPPYGNVFN